MMIQFVFYSIIFLCIANWVQIRYLLGNTYRYQKIIQIQESRLIKKLKKKTGLDVIIQVMDEDKKAIGFMLSSQPFKPVMIFSKKLYNEFNAHEFEWVALHECAHYLMNHNMKTAASQLFFLSAALLGIYLFSFNIITSLCMTMLMAIFYIRFDRIFEYQADHYAAEHMDNPRGMISGNIKMRKMNSSLDGNQFLKELFVIAVPYEERIRIAEEELKKRGKR